jgi:hypothetical protein
MDPSFLRQKHTRQMRANRFKLGLMIVLLIGVLYGMFHLGQQYVTEEPSGEPVVGQKIVSQKLPVKDIESAEGREAGSPLAVADEEMAKKFNFLDEPKTLEQVEPQSTDIEPAPFFYLLYQVHKDAQDELKQAAEERGRAEWETLWDKGGDLRGKPIEVSGRIVSIRTQRLGKNPLGMKRLTVYRIRRDGATEEEADVPETAEPPAEAREDASPEEPLIQLVDLYAIEKLHGALRNDHVTACGRYLKAQTIPPEPERLLEDPDLHVAVVVAKQLQPLTYLDDPEPPGPIVQGNRPEARAFYWFLNQAMDTDLKSLRKTARENLTFVDLTTQPERYRGTPIALTGGLRNLHRIRLPENPLQLKDVFYGQVVDADLKMNTFYCLEIPEGIRLKDEVVILGYFMKTWGYTSRDNRLVASPVIVGKTMQKIRFERDYTYEIVLCIIFAVVIIIMLAAYFRERNRQLVADEARRERQRQRMPKNLNELARRAAHRTPAAGEPPPENEAPDPTADEEPADAQDDSEPPDPPNASDPSDEPDPSDPSDESDPSDTPD